MNRPNDSAKAWIERIHLQMKMFNVEGYVYYQVNYNVGFYELHIGHPKIATVQARSTMLLDIERAVQNIIDTRG